VIRPEVAELRAGIARLALLAFARPVVGRSRHRGFQLTWAPGLVNAAPVITSTLNLFR